MPIKFTNATVKKLAVEAGRKDRLVFSSDVPTLGLRIGANGSKTFVFQDRTKSGRTYRKPLGRYGALTIEAAEKLAKIESGKIAAGFDPHAERQTARQIAKSDYTVERMIEDWKANARLKDGAALRETYKRKVELRLRLGFGETLLNRAAASISEQELEQAIDEIEAPEARRNFAVSVKSVFGWTKAKRKITANPAAELALPEGGSSRERTPTLEEMQRVWRAAATLGPSYRGSIRYLMLTLVRRSEAAGSLWSEVNMSTREHVIPGARMKSRRSHTIPLSSAAFDLLKNTPRLYGSDLVFPGEGAKAISWGHVKTKLDRALAEDGDPKMQAWRLHDIRRSGASCLASLGVKLEVADKLLAHAKSAKLPGVASTYQRYEFLTERRAALQLWAEHLTGDYCLAAASSAAAGAVAVEAPEFALDLAELREGKTNACRILLDQAVRLGDGQPRQMQMTLGRIAASESAVEAAEQVFSLAFDPHFAAAAKGAPPQVWGLRALLMTTALAVEDGRTVWKRDEVEATRAGLCEAGLADVARLLPAPESREVVAYRKDDPESRHARAQGVYVVLLALTVDMFGSERPAIARGFANAGFGADLVTADARRRRAA
jgi:integrase